MATEKETFPGLPAAEISSPQSEGSEFETRDAKEMHAMGKKQQLRRNFEFWSSQLVTFIEGLINGGPEGLIISLFVTWTAMAAMVASMAELMSMWPTSGGQYHWTYTLSPPKLAPFFSYVCGWTTVLAWQAATASVAFLSGTFMQEMISLNNPSYIPKPWQGLLLAYAVLTIGILGNTVFAKWLPKVEWAALFLYTAGFVVMLITITVLSPHKASAQEVFTVFINGGNWGSNGVSWFVGLQGIIFAWIGADAAIHMAEECRDASRILPWSLMGSVVINGVMSVAMLLAVLFCGGDLLSAAANGGLYPIIPILKYATGSAAGGTGLSVIVLLIQFAAQLTIIAAVSRELWAFARDNGVPASGWLKQVHTGFKLPLNSIFITAMFSLLLNLIQLGSSVALNAVVSLTVSALMTSYFIPFSLVFYRRIQAIRGKGKELPWGPWTLGRWTGPLINAYALIWVALVWIWSFFPPTGSPTPTTMNWSSTVYGGVLIFAGVFWLIDGRHRYFGPVRDAAGDAIEPITGWEKW